MEIKLTNKNSKKINPVNLIDATGTFWNNNYRIFFAVAFVVAFGLGGYFWYESLYQSAWSDQERENYKTAKDSGINFKENDFSGALDIIEKRKVEYVQEQSSLRDIFKNY